MDCMMESNIDILIPELLVDWYDKCNRSNILPVETGAVDILARIYCFEIFIDIWSLKYDLKEGEP